MDEPSKRDRATLACFFVLSRWFVFGFGSFRAGVPANSGCEGERCKRAAPEGRRRPTLINPSTSIGASATTTTSKPPDLPAVVVTAP